MASKAGHREVPDSYRAGTLVLGKDGVISPGRHSPWRYDPAALDVDLIREAQRRGLAVAVSTCSDVDSICEALRAARIRCYADHAMRHWSWHDGAVVLVTNRKVHGLVFADDHALRFDYGDDHANIWRAAEAERGYAYCPAVGHHWGRSARPACCRGPSVTAGSI